MKALPTFKYHPNPLETGSIVESDDECVCCERERGYMYVGPVFAEEELDESICPWCIASGLAFKKFETEFTDAASIGGGIWPELSEEIIAEVAHHTPGFIGLQQERWAACCNDAAAFIETAGHKELTDKYPDAIDDIRSDFEASGGDWESWFKSLDADGSATAYVFQCLHCKRHTGYSDSD
ncbi:MAG: CbrC family protein [Gemmatimonadaceae bacterium]